MGNVLMRLHGNIFLSDSWKQELVITDERVESEVIKGFQRTKRHLPYDRIAQVNLVRGVFKADLELVNKGGVGTTLLSKL